MNMRVFRAPGSCLLALFSSFLSGRSCPAALAGLLDEGHVVHCLGGLLLERLCEGQPAARSHTAASSLQVCRAAPACMPLPLPFHM